MLAFVSLLALTAATEATVREGGAGLRAGCSADAVVVTRLAGGTPVEVRLSISGELGTCYKVAAGSASGYLVAGELSGLESFENARRAGNQQGLPQMIRAEIGRLKDDLAEQARRLPAAGPNPASGLDPSVASALNLIESNQPRRALELIESDLLRTRPKDPFVLSLAGLAAYQSDQPRSALAYWGESLAIRPNPSIEALYRRAQKELAADTSRSRMLGTRFVLRYNDSEIGQATAQEILNALNEEYNRIDMALGCNLSEQSTVVVQTMDVYRAASTAAEWSGGQFDGRIRIGYEGRALTPRTRQAMAHELVHACLARNGQFPAWFHEGMAQRWSGERISQSELNTVRQMLRNRRMPGLNQMPPSWGKLSSWHANLAYAFSLAAVDALYSTYGDQYVRNLLRSPERLSSLADTVSRSIAGL
jgi:hypothetical protein